MGIMYFDSQPIPEVDAFIKKHYKGGSVIDYGCGCGRYAHCFPDDVYIGIDGHEGNIKAAKKLHPNKEFVCTDLEEWVQGYITIDNLFSSVVFDQIEKLPIGQADKYILVENKKYRDKFKVIVDEGLKGSEETRLMVCVDNVVNTAKQ